MIRLDSTITIYSILVSGVKSVSPSPLTPSGASISNVFVDKIMQHRNHAACHVVSRGLFELNVLLEFDFSHRKTSVETKL